MVSFLLIEVFIFNLRPVNMKLQHDALSDFSTGFSAMAKTIVVPSALCLFIP